MGIQDRPATRTLSSPPSVSGGASVSDFDLVKVIGQGSFGKVFLVRPRWTNDATVYAMKVVKKDDVRRRNQMEHTKVTVDVAASRHAPHVTSIYSHVSPHFACTGGTPHHGENYASFRNFSYVRVPVA